MATSKGAVGPFSLTPFPTPSGLLCYLLAAKQAGLTRMSGSEQYCAASGKYLSLSEPQRICRGLKQNSMEGQAPWEVSVGKSVCCQMPEFSPCNPQAERGELTSIQLPSDLHMCVMSCSPHYQSVCQSINQSVNQISPVLFL